MFGTVFRLLGVNYYGFDVRRVNFIANFTSVRGILGLAAWLFILVRFTFGLVNVGGGRFVGVDDSRVFGVVILLVSAFFGVM